MSENKTKRRKAVDTSDFTIDGHPDELMERYWVAWRFGIAPGTFDNWIRDSPEKVPPPVKFGTGARPTLRWKRGVVNQFIDEQQAA